MKETRLLDIHGFQSIDDYPSRSAGITAVMHNGEDLMTIHAGSDVGKLVRALFEKLFPENERGDYILAPKRHEADRRLEAPSEILDKFTSMFLKLDMKPSFPLAFSKTLLRVIGILKRSLLRVKILTCKIQHFKTGNRHRS